MNVIHLYDVPGMHEIRASLTKAARRLNAAPETLAKAVGMAERDYERRHATGGAWQTGYNFMRKTKRCGRVARMEGDAA
jgi:uncharacterized protein (DUF2384 family)